jgi:hypothetical protein
MKRIQVLHISEEIFNYIDAELLDGLNSIQSEI